MTRDDIIRMAREHHMQALPLDCYAGHIVNLESLVKAAFDAGSAAEREKVAQWMMQRGYATGHGDTTEDLLAELEWQIAENWTRAMVKGVETEREECAKVCEEWGAFNKIAAECAEAIRARGCKTSEGGENENT